MRIVNDELLQRFREAIRCEYCGVYKPTGCDPAHIYARGIGSGSRLDVALNLVALCRTCHTSHHAGKAPLRSELVKIVAAREGCTMAYVVEEIYRLLRTDKHAHLLETVRE